MEFRKMVTITLYAKQKKSHRYTEQNFGICGRKVRVGYFERTASKHVYYLGWNRSPAQAGCMRQVLRPGALGRPRGIGWRGRWEGWSVHTYICKLFFPLWFITRCWIYFLVLYSETLLFIKSIYNNLHPLIPNA